VHDAHLLAVKTESELGQTTQRKRPDRAEHGRVDGLLQLISTMSVLVLMILNFSTDTAEGNFSLPINVVLSVVSVGSTPFFW
jgi:hypothetical protein